MILISISFFFDRKRYKGMATPESDTNQGQQKVVLKRKLTGPPRLLLGKAKTVNHIGERSDARALRHQRRMDANGTPKHSSPPTTQDALGEEDTTLTLQKAAKRETEGSYQARLQNDYTTCDAGSEEDTVKEQNLDVCRKTKRTTKEGLRRLFPHMFMCVKRRRDKHDDLKMKRGNAMTPQSMECTGEDTHSTDDTISPGATCYHTSNTDTEFGTGHKVEKRRVKTAWLPFVGRHAHRSRCLAKDSQMIVTPKDVKLRKKTLRKRIQGFLTRQKKAVSSNQSEGGATQTPEPERVERQVDSHLDNNEDQDLSRLHKEDIQERDGEDHEGCPDTMTVSAEVTVASGKGTECEPSEEDSGELSCKMLENVTSRKDKNELENCADTQEPSESHLNESPGLCDSVATVTCVAELDSDFRPHIDIAMTTDEVFQNGSDEIQFDNTVVATGPESDSFVPCKNPGNMSFLTVPVDGCWSLCEANSTDVKPCCNTYDRSLPPEDTSPLSNESLLVLTANSLVRAAIKSALCQLSREIQSPLTNSHREEAV